MNLIVITHCPVCGDTGREPASDGIASRRRDTGRHYLAHAAARLGVPLEQALESINVYQCTQCKSYYCDPWIGADTAAHIFTEAAPDHIAGWANFEHWLSSPQPNAVAMSNQRLRTLLAEKIGTLDSYAEYGCPFQGLLLNFRGSESTPQQRVQEFASAIRRKPDVRWTTGPRLHHSAQWLANVLAVSYHWLRAIKTAPRGKSTSLPLPPIPKVRKLLVESNTAAWGNNCVRYGGSCSYYASKVLSASPLPFREQLRGCADKHGDRIDLLGMFNILDHTDDPLRVIREGLALARHVVITTHHASIAGKQHLFAFHDSFPEWLQESLADTQVQNLTQAINIDGKQAYQYILLSNRPC